MTWDPSVQRESPLEQAMQRTMMSKVEAAIEPDSVFGYLDTMLRIHGPIPWRWNVRFTHARHGLLDF